MLLARPLMDLPDLVAPDILLKTRRSAYVPAGFLRLAGRDLIAGGTDVTTVAGLLGHAQPSTTLDIYSHAFDKNKREASRAMQAGLEI